MQEEEGMMESLPADVQAAVRAGRKIEAIKLLRERTGLGLAEAKAAVESGILPDAVSRPVDADALPVEVMSALAAGEKVEAIRLLRQSRGIGLAEAKALVDGCQVSGGRTGGSRNAAQAGARTFVRILGLLALLGVSVFCMFGFLATYEDSDAARRLPWQIGYGLIGLGCLAGIVGILRRTCCRCDQGRGDAIR
jgi:ribosomal protein L7/L12